MLEAKDAVKVSLSTFSDLFTDEIFQDLRLEEIALEQDNHLWNITVSYRNPDFDEELQARRAEDSGALGIFQGKVFQVHTRHYKSITINAEDGSLVKVKSA